MALVYARVVWQKPWMDMRFARWNKLSPWASLSKDSWKRESLQVVLLTSPNAIFAFCASPIVASGYKMVSPCHFHLYLDLVQHPNDHQVVMTNHTGAFKDIIKHNFKHEATTQVSKVSFGCSSLMHTENSPQYKSCMVHKTWDAKVTSIRNVPKTCRKHIPIEVLLYKPCNPLVTSLKKSSPPLLNTDEDIT